MIKRILAFILALVMVMIVTACAADTGRRTETGTNITKAADIDNGTEGAAAEQDKTAAIEETADKDDGAAISVPVDGSGIHNEEAAGQDGGAVNGDIAEGPEADGVSVLEEAAESAGNETVEGAEATTETTAETEKSIAPVEPEEPVEIAKPEPSVSAGPKAGSNTETIPNDPGTSVKPAEADGNGDNTRALEGRVICIDPGHQTRGNYDTEPVAPGSGEMKAKVSSGTAGVKTRIPEYKLVLDVSLKLRDALEGYGATVIMTRTVNDVDISNAERAQIANDANADLYFRVHCDGSANKSVHGVSVLIPGNKYITDKYILEESKKAGSSILESFVKVTGAKDRGLSVRNDLSGFNWCTVPMALIELGFMSNAEEDVKLSTAEYQDKMVKGIVEGMIDYFSGRS